MIYKTNKKLYKTLKVIACNRLLRKKNLLFIKQKNIKQINICLKLQFKNYNLFISLFKNISIYYNLKNKFNFMFF